MAESITDSVTRDRLVAGSRSGENGVAVPVRCGWADSPLMARTSVSMTLVALLRVVQDGA